MVRIALVRRWLAEARLYIHSLFRKQGQPIGKLPEGDPYVYVVPTPLSDSPRPSQMQVGRERRASDLQITPVIVREHDKDLTQLITRLVLDTPALGNVVLIVIGNITVTDGTVAVGTDIALGVPPSSTHVDPPDGR